MISKTTIKKLSREFNEKLDKTEARLDLLINQHHEIVKKGLQEIQNLELKYREREYDIQLKNIDVLIDIIKMLLGTSITLLIASFSLSFLEGDFFKISIITSILIIILIILLLIRWGMAKQLNKKYEKSYLENKKQLVENAEMYNKYIGRQLDAVDKLSKLQEKRYMNEMYKIKTELQNEKVRVEGDLVKLKP